jgi:putative redox protein
MPTSISSVRATSSASIACFEGAVDDEQEKRMADIAERTPVTLTLKGGLEIRTTLA